MTKQNNMVAGFEFLIGNWNLKYRVPKSAFSGAGTGLGTGTFKRALNDKYVYFDYSVSLTTGKSEAHGIFAWDEDAKVYRYWWFENTGVFMTARCSFINNETLFIDWLDSGLTQTFTKVEPNIVILRLEHAASEQDRELILEVLFTMK